MFNWTYPKEEADVANHFSELLNGIVLASVHLRLRL